MKCTGRCEGFHSYLKGSLLRAEFLYHNPRVIPRPYCHTLMKQAKLSRFPHTGNKYAKQWWKHRFTVLLGRFFSGQNIFTGPVKTETATGKHFMETYLPNRQRRPSWSRTSPWLPWLASRDASTLHLCTDTHSCAHAEIYLYRHIHTHTGDYIYTHGCLCIYDWLHLCLCIYNLLCSAVFLTFVVMSIICGWRRLSHEMWWAKLVCMSSLKNRGLV